MNPLIPLFVRADQDESFDIEVEVTKFAETVGWSNVLKEAFGILSRESQKPFWQYAAGIIYWAVSDQIPLPFPIEETAARLYRCLEQYPGFGNTGLADGENLVWSIVSKLKGVSYESSWDPLEDPAIKEKLIALRIRGHRVH